MKALGLCNFTLICWQESTPFAYIFLFGSPSSHVIAETVFFHCLILCKCRRHLGSQCYYPQLANIRDLGNIFKQEWEETSKNRREGRAVLAVQRDPSPPPHHCLGLGAGVTSHTLSSLGDTRGKWPGKQSKSPQFAPTKRLVM